MAQKRATEQFQRRNDVTVDGRDMLINGDGELMRAEVVFGNVTVNSVLPSPERVKANVARSSFVLSQIGKALAKPGVKLSRKKGIPFFSVDENDPSIFIRSIDGHEERGRMVNGTFETL